MSIEAMKQALEALVRADRISGHPNNGKTITALRAAIAEASMQRLTDVQQAMEQEPVAWRVHPFDYAIGHEGVFAVTQLPQQRDVWIRKGWNVTPLYTHPPRREWVGLTDDEKAKLDDEYGDDILAHLDAIEAKLKEKNS
jgi:hypothetical protein